MYISKPDILCQSIPVFSINLHVTRHVHTTQYTAWIQYFTQGNHSNFPVRRSSDHHNHHTKVCDGHFPIVM